MDLTNCHNLSAIKTCHSRNLKFLTFWFSAYSYSYFKEEKKRFEGAAINIASSRGVGDIFGQDIAMNRQNSGVGFVKN